MRYLHIVSAMAAWTALYASACAFTSVQAGTSVWMEDLTWQEIRDDIKNGKTTVIVPTGGTEQNGPHIILGKHNFVLRYTAMAIAEQLKNALVAPIMEYVPEGNIDPPVGHMRFPGTLSLHPAVFAAVLEDTARSLKQAGFKTICFIGEHGASQEPQREVADKLNAEWKGQGVQVIHVNEYYDGHNGQVQWLVAQGIKERNPEAHGGLADTAEMLAVYPSGVRTKLIADYGPDDFEKLGVDGSPKQASLLIGAKLIALKVQGAVRQIQRETQPAH